MIKTLALDSSHVRQDTARPLAAWLNDIADACAP
jgi:hypothetical protein